MNQTYVTIVAAENKSWKLLFSAGCLERSVKNVVAHSGKRIS